MSASSATTDADPELPVMAGADASSEVSPAISPPKSAAKGNTANGASPRGTPLRTQPSKPQAPKATKTIHAKTTQGGQGQRDPAAPALLALLLELAHLSGGAPRRGLHRCGRRSRAADGLHAGSCPQLARCARLPARHQDVGGAEQTARGSGAWSAACPHASGTLRLAEMDHLGASTLAALGEGRR